MYGAMKSMMHCMRVEFSLPIVDSLLPILPLCHFFGPRLRFFFVRDDDSDDSDEEPSSGSTKGGGTFCCAPIIPVII